MLNVIVYILNDNKIDRESNNVLNARIRRIFSHSSFIVYESSHTIPSFISPDNEEKIEIFGVKSILQECASKYATLPCIVVKNTSVSVTSADIIAAAVQRALGEAVLSHNDPNYPFDVCYLCVWDDKCQLHTDKKEVGDGLSLVTTQAPQGLQCILFSPSGRDIVLGNKPMKNGELFACKSCLASSLTEAIFNGNLTAACFSPSLLHFDINYAVTNDDFNKRRQCEQVNTRQLGEVKMGYSELYWVLIALAIVVIFFIIIERRR